MMRNSRRGLAAGVNFIWDLPMIPLLKFSNIHRHRGRETSLSKPPQFNSIRVCSDFERCEGRGAASAWTNAPQMLPNDLVDQSEEFYLSHGCAQRE